jgi:hypothetical protein
MLSTGANKESGGRDRSRLERARANGYLNANCRTRETVARAHGFWCWRLRVPLIWFARNSPRSKYGRVHLDLFTTAHVLTGQGRAELANLLSRLGLPGQAAISAGDGQWTGIPAARLEEVARTALRVATRMGNYELRERSAPAAPEWLAELERSVLPWRKSA